MRIGARKSRESRPSAENAAYLWVHRRCVRRSRERPAPVGTAQPTRADFKALVAAGLETGHGVGLIEPARAGRGPGSGDSASSGAAGAEGRRGPRLGPAVVRRAGPVTLAGLSR